MNSMCKDCPHLNKACSGTKSEVWTGCVLKNRPEDEAAAYIEKMTEILERGKEK